MAKRERQISYIDKDERLLNFASELEVSNAPNFQKIQYFLKTSNFITFNYFPPNQLSTYSIAFFSTRLQ